MLSFRETTKDEYKADASGEHQANLLLVAVSYASFTK